MLVAVLVVVGSCWTAQAQPDTLRIRPIAPSAQARAGIVLVTNGRPAAALPVLQDAVRADSALVVPTRGSAAYWLGEAYARVGDSASARSTWAEGLHALDAAGQFDVRLADAYLRGLSPEQLRGERLWAARQYRRLLRQVRPDTTAAVRAVFRRRIAQLEPLLPDDVFAAIVDEARDTAPSRWTFRPGAGPALLRWMRGLDPFPATPENERLEEHIARLVRAQRAFSCPDAPSALDARGRTHLRFGAPFQRRVLGHKDGKLFREVFRFGVPISPSGFPEGELWAYSQIDEAAYYLFVEDQATGCFETATANELLPNTLQYSRGDSDRGLNIAYSSLMAQRAIYRELALYHADFSGRYNEIANYAGWQEMKATAAQVGLSTGSTQQTTVGAGVGQTRIVSSDPVLGIPPPTQFVTQIVARADREDRQAARERKRVLPRHYTALRGDTPELPVAVRTARFLAPNGTTRTTVYWGLRSADAALQGDTSAVPSTIALALTQADSTRAPQTRRHRRYRLPATSPSSGRGFVPSPLVLDAPAGRYHLSLQWTQYRRWANTDGPMGDIGPKRRLALARADSLRPLRAHGPLEMSDVMVRSLTDTAAAAPTTLLDRSAPYPFRVVTPDTPLLLSFELYHLGRGPDDRTRYTLAYEVQGRTRRGWTRLVRGQETQQTATETTVEGTKRRTHETILLDLSEVARGEAQDVQVTVQVTDEVTGATASRTVNFVLQTGDGA